MKLIFKISGEKKDIDALSDNADWRSLWEKSGHAVMTRGRENDNTLYLSLAISVPVWLKELAEHEYEDFGKALAEECGKFNLVSKQFSMIFK